jgi:TPR repeat protein
MEIEMKFKRFVIGLLTVMALSLPIFGQPTERELRESRETSELQTLAEQGDAKSQYQLAQRCEEGIGIKLSWVEAAKWYKKSSAQGYYLATQRLAFAEGKAKDEAREKTYTDAKLADLQSKVKQGIAWAQTDLGGMYIRGEGVPADPKEGYRLIGLAAEQGEPRAQCVIAQKCLDGKNVEEAMKLLLLSASQGYKDAQFKLGLLYFKGEVIPVNMFKSYVWISITGEYQSIKDMAASHLTLEELKQAQEHIIKIQNEIKTKKKP